jgi:ferredoxin
MKFFTITHEQASCIGCGSCEYEAPQTWELDPETGLSRLKNGTKHGKYTTAEIDEMDLAANTRACDSCPMRIISLQEKK